MGSKFHKLDEDFSIHDDSMDEPKKPVKRARGRPKGSKNMGVSKHVSFTPEKKKKYIKAVQKNGGNKKAAAAAIGISITTVYAHEKKDPVFKEKVDEAKDYALHELAEEMRRRGVEGWDEPVYYQGQHVGDIRKYSDTLLVKRIEALDPETYGKRSQLDINQNITVDNQAKTKLASLLGLEIDDPKVIDGDRLD